MGRMGFFGEDFCGETKSYVLSGVCFCVDCPRDLLETDGSFFIGDTQNLMR